MLWASYAQIRTELRNEIGNKSDAYTRTSILFDGVRNNFSWFDPYNAQQQIAFTRLNQNILIGESVNYLENGNGNPAYGDTFIEASIALVPRVLWPGKPAYGGSGGLVSRYTGLQFAEGTSVGIGQVMECYVNFGRWFVFILFFAVGVILKLLDGAIENAFVTAHPAALLLSFVIGVNWLNVIGSFSETFPAIVGAAVLALATIFLHNLLWSRYKV